jgi:NAD(P)-dependent dehydrogenase (short-subunit alcohol dehydrogenase family)
MSARKALAGEIALVTGASRGIGAAAALELARHGAHVILTARTVGGLEEVDDRIQAIGGSATLVPLDLAEHEKIDALGAGLHARFGKLDMLVGNAGILGELTPLAHADPKQWQRVMDVNLTANWRLIRSLDPLLRLSGSGRALFITSGVARRVAPYWGAYAVSKSALEALVRIYAAEAETSGLRVNLFDPGATATKMRALAMPGEDATELPSPEEVATALAALLLPQERRNGETIRFKRVVPATV